MQEDIDTATALLKHRPESESGKAYRDTGVQTVSFRDAEGHARGADYCGRGAIVGLSTDGETIVVVPIRCRKWACETCGNVRKHRVAARIAMGLPNKFITLTTKKDDGSTPEERFALAKRAWPVMVKRIRAKFGNFEYACVWELSSAGSAHCHVAARAEYLPQRWLSAQWKELTGSEIVDIRAVKNVRKVAYYVTKYMLKQAAETSDVLDGRRVLQFSGAYDLDIDPDEPQPESVPFVWKWVDKSLFKILGELEGEIYKWTIQRAPSGVLTISKRSRSERVLRLEFSLGGDNVILTV